MQIVAERHFGHARSCPGPRVLGRSFWDNRFGIERARAVDLARRRDQPAVGEQCDKCVGGDESTGGIEERSPDLGWIDAGIVKESVG